MKKLFWIVPGALAVLVAAVFLAVNLIGKAKYSGRELQEFSLYTVKNLDGGVDSVEITKSDDGRTLYCLMTKDTYYQMPFVFECYVSEEIFSDIEGIFRKYNLAACERWKDSDEYAEDGSSWNITFAFDGRTAGYSSYKKLPKREEEARTAIMDCISRYVDEGEKLPELKVTPITEEEWEKLISPEDGNVTVRILYYWNDAIKVIISNGTDTRVEYDHSYKIYKDGSGKPFISVTGDYTDEFIRNSYSEDLLYIENRLEPGKYVLEIMGRKIDFEIE